MLLRGSKVFAFIVDPFSETSFLLEKALLMRIPNHVFFFCLFVEKRKKKKKRKSKLEKTHLNSLVKNA